ncbi:helix-turn-helix transcriptional regulator [Kibdelosporangium philippinense]|uniref:Helix-turn-helix transcriptional regulator n=1 Tax=Kibdelosporangium philippinense TaxID=211113 RepID=A0ABS8ZM53_9PSEU|nr:helix-turn-helix transcriptional regulator [Kibdelosporangium philippinense]MCE7007533.1 helix-turn-helix transcriptional regulator [Kibdelosporangium philippinense]
MSDAILAALRPVIEGLAATFGPSCEVVLHDYRQGERSVVAVAGDVTGRRVGGSLSEIGLAVLAKGDLAENDLNYVTSTPDGRVVKSSTMPLRDEEGHVFGALCVNIDVTALRQAGDLLSALAGTTSVEVAPTTFTDDFAEVVDAVVRKEELVRGKPFAALNRVERLGLIKALDERGVFAVRNAALRVAERLGISRSGLYADLSECRKQES